MAAEQPPEPDEPRTLGELRASILDAHSAIRCALARLMAASRSVSLGWTCSTTRLDEAIRELCARMDAHLAFEERYLPLIFDCLDGEGSPRKRALLDEHCAQRADLRALFEACAKGDGPPAELATYAHRLATSLLSDMAAEEKTFEFLDDAPQAPIERRSA